MKCLSLEQMIYSQLAIVNGLVDSFLDNLHRTKFSNTEIEDMLKNVQQTLELISYSMVQHDNPKD